MDVSNLNNSWKIAAFYHFTQFSDYEEWADRLLKHGLSVGLKGTIILASEGINSTCSGSEDAINSTIKLLKNDNRFSDIEVKYSYADFCPFPKFKVKKKPEIVTFRKDNADPLESVGEYIDPSQWNSVISDPNVITIDTRNDYEVKVGKFKGALNPKTDDFTGFAEFVDKQLLEHKEKKIAMYCTGGIRCERSTAYLKKKGFNKVCHLKGGILNYFQKVPSKDSMWTGDCFVFDYRVAVNHDLKPALWKIDPDTNLPEKMNPDEVNKISERRRSGAIFKKPYTF